MSRMLLHIDPDPSTRLLVRKVLIPAGFTVLEAADFRDASDVAEQSRPDLVLVDVDGGDAADLVRTVRTLPGMDQSVLLASTSDHRPDRLTQTADAGFQGVLTKPLDVDRLAQELARHLRGPGKDPAVEVSTIATPAQSQPDAPMHPLWRPTLAPIVASVVRNAATAYGLLALRDEADNALIIVATHATRPVDDIPPIGTRIPLSAVGWLLPALHNRTTVLLRSQELEAVSLVPALSTVVAAAPVAGGQRVYGVAILGERRQRPFGLPEAQVAQCAAEAARIGTILQALEQRNEAIRRRRLELDHARLAAARALALGLPLDLKREDRDAARRVRLGLGLADRLALPVVERTVLEQALETHDLGRCWLERILPPLMTLRAPASEAALDAEAHETSAFVRGLGWPEPVLELLESSRTALHAPDAPLTARILSVVVAYHELERAVQPTDRPFDVERALAELRRTCSSRVDTILTALHALVVEDEHHPT